MKKSRLSLIPALFALAACGPEDLPGGNGGSGSSLPQFDFSNYSKNAVKEVLTTLQQSVGYKIEFEYAYYNDANSITPTETYVVELGGLAEKTWMKATVNGETNGYGIKVQNNEFTYYELQGNTWNLIATSQQTQEMMNGYFDEALDFITINDDDLQKIDFSSKKEGGTILSRDTYEFGYQGETSVTIKVDKILGIALYYSITYADVSAGTASRAVITTTGVNITNVEAPNF